MNQLQALEAFKGAVIRYHERGAECAYLNKLGVGVKLDAVLEDLGIKAGLAEVYPSWSQWRGSFLTPVESIAERYRVKDRWTGEVGLRWLSLLDHVLASVSLSNSTVYSAAFSGAEVTASLFNPIRKIT